MAPGLPGAPDVTLMQEGALAPQALLATTHTVPLNAFAGKVMDADVPVPLTTAPATEDDQV